MTSLIAYETLCRYAKTCCRQKRVHEADVEDITHDAWIECQRRARACAPDANPAAVARRIMFTSIQDCIRRHRNWTGHDPSFDESDGGTAAERIFLAVDDWETPFWLRLFAVTRKELERDARNGTVSKLVPRTVTALMEDSRLPVARAVLKVSRPTFGTILRILKVRFALCFRAYGAYRSFSRTLRS